MTRTKRGGAERQAVSGRTPKSPFAGPAAVFLKATSPDLANDSVATAGRRIKEP